MTDKPHQTQTLERTAITGEVGPPVVAVTELHAESAQPQTRLSNLDRRLAWVVSIAPPLAFVIGLWLWRAGFPPGWSEWTLLVVFYLLALTGVEVGFHRHFTHQAFKAKQWVRVTLAILGSFAFEGPVIWWATTHRRHHKYSDRQGDPHSPHLHGDGMLARLKGAFHAHLGWLFRPSSTRYPQAYRYAIDLYRDAAILRVQMAYFHLLVAGILLPGIINGLIHRSWTAVAMGVLWGGIIRIFLMNHVFFWCINSVTHLFGSRPFDTGDRSTNNIWLALPTLGEAWHNNHHAFPRAAVLSFRWWQIDPGGWIICALEKAGVVWDVRRATPTAITARMQPQRPA